MKKYIKIPNADSTIVINGFIFGVEGPEWNLKEHYHTIFELTLCTEGSALQWINGECFNFNKGDWIFLKPGARHKTINKSKSVFSYMSIHFDIDDLCLRKFLKNSKLNHIPYQQADETKLKNYTAEIDNLIQKIIINKNYIMNEEEIILNLTEIDKLRFLTNIMAVILEYIQLVEPKNIASGDNQITNQHLEVAYKIETLLKNNIAGTFNINEISEIVGYSRSHCTKIFNQVYGSSPRHYYTTLKLKKAKELLLLTNKGIDEISSELGFSSVYHFSRQFKRWTAKSPSEYRLNPTAVNINSYNPIVVNDM